MKKYQKFLAVIGLLPLVAINAVCQSGQTQTPETGGKMPNIVNFETAQRHEIKPQDLPPPFATESVRKNSRIIAQPADAVLNLPKGFKANVFAEGGFTYPRWMALAPNGDVFVADSRANAIVVLRDKDKDGTAEERFTFTQNVSQPFGMAFHGDWFYVANTDSVVRFKYKSGQTQADGAAPEKLIELTEGGPERREHARMRFLCQQPEQDRHGAVRECLRMRPALAEDVHTEASLAHV